MSDSRKPSDTVSVDNQHDALSVLRDLVRQLDYWGMRVIVGVPEWDETLARARALAAEHTTEEER
jgi:hypothetical protein